MPSLKSAGLIESVLMTSLLAKAVYALINQFPATEKYALSDQVRRAVVSIPSNIAEGCGRASDRDYAHFLSIARGSLYETMTQLEFAQSLGYIDAIKDVEELALEISRMLTKLRNTRHSPTLQLQLVPPTCPSHSPSPTPASNFFYPCRTCRRGNISCE